jgi:hypothetical protein
MAEGFHRIVAEVTTKQQQIQPTITVVGGLFRHELKWVTGGPVWVDQGGTVHDEHPAGYTRTFSAKYCVWAWLYNGQHFV